MKELLVVSCAPELKGKNYSWFRRNIRNIERGSSQNPFWARNTIYIGSDWSGMRPLVEKLIDMGYEIATWPEQHGEFSVRGGTILLYPINEKGRFRIDFLGNTLDTIKPLHDSESTIEKEKRKTKLFEYLRNGDYVVHQDHGIGIWRGIVKENNKDYFLIEYRGPRGGSADTLLVPATEEKRISIYIGFRSPPITRLGTPIWKRTLKKTREDAREFAKKLLTVHASRSLINREGYKTYSPLEDELASSFPYKETPSQQRALLEIMKDLESNTPMDRIVIGDVGFGKTELALRASVRVAESGKQVAILAPTTLLADQHYKTWTKRLEGLPLNIVRISRLESKKDIHQSLTKIKNGDIDIIVGTHRLLSRDVQWKNLGLLIVDEEQRFGVSAKEHIKNIKKDIDVLTLSATPLPRTFSLALAGLRRMSTLEKGPDGRIAPHTFTLPFKKEIVKHALLHEIKRKGQVYVLENRIKKIPKTIELLQSLLPKQKIGYIHGRLGEKQLSETMEKFRDNKVEILVSTTIIENGIDLANVNTLLVTDAMLLGLAEMHQLRGRIGRGDRDSFAYFLYEPKKITEKGAARLDVISNTQFLGSGAVIAEKDLEMRGAGNILGREQSGSAGRVGLNLYSQFLAEAVEELRK